LGNAHGFLTQGSFGVDPVGISPSDYCKQGLANSAFISNAIN
jgi:hypothetical protein